MGLLLNGFVLKLLAFGLASLCIRAVAAGADPETAAFILAKRKEAESRTEETTNPVPAEVWRMFDAAASADWTSTSNLFDTILLKYKPLWTMTQNQLADTMLLIELNRADEVQRLITQAEKLHPEDPTISSLVEYVRQFIDGKARPR